jgi:tripartite-type tricarboxylate transporter receptor subunit TctC
VSGDRSEIVAFPPRFPSIRAAAETVAQAEVRNRLADMGTLVTPMRAKEFGAFIQSETAKWRDAVKSANVKIE